MTVLQQFTISPELFAQNLLTLSSRSSCTFRFNVTIDGLFSCHRPLSCSYPAPADHEKFSLRDRCCCPNQLVGKHDIAIDITRCRSTRAAAEKHPPSRITCTSPPRRVQLPSALRWITPMCPAKGFGMENRVSIATAKLRDYTSNLTYDFLVQGKG
jgi:hypothetical protein